MIELRDKLADTLLDVYRLEALDNLKVFLEGEIGVLFLLCNSQERQLSPTDISMRLQITKGRVTALINALRKKEYIHITVSERDRRMFLVSLSDRGYDFIKGKMNNANIFLDKVIKIVGEDKIEALVSNVNIVVEKLKEEA